MNGDALDPQNTHTHTHTHTHTQQQQYPHLVIMCAKYCAWCLGHASSVSSVTGTWLKDPKQAADFGAIASACSRVTLHLE
jgi:hypothetical protein